MKKHFFATYALLLVASILAMPACKKEKTVKEVAVTGIIIAPTGDVSVDVGATSTLTATVTPANAANKTIHWSSLDPGIATVSVSTGAVTGVSPGTATILATAADGGGATATKTVTVNALVNAQAPAITTQPQSATYAQDATASALSVTASVTDGGTLSYQWFSNATNSASGGTPVGANSSYTPPTTSVGALYYYVVITNTNNSVNGAKTAATTSAVATITVTEIPTYTIIASPTSLDFGSQQAGYAQPPAQTVTIINNGNQTITNTGNQTITNLTAGTLTGYTVGTLSATSLAPNATATFTVRPNSGLATGTHNGAITISGSNGTSATVSATFEVTAAKTVTFLTTTQTVVQRDRANYNIATTGIDNGTSSGRTSRQWFSNAAGTIATAAPAGVANAIYNVTNNAATMEVLTSILTTTPPGTYYFRETIDGVQSSNVATLIVTAAPTYTISATPPSLNFGSLQTGYTQPAAQTVTITNTGNQTITNLTRTTLTGYILGTLSTTSIAPNATATFTVHPNFSLTHGTHNGTITISGSNGARTTVSVSFTVTVPEPPMVLVSGGVFPMGAPDSETQASSNERPVHLVAISTFYMGKYQVTQKEWVEIMGSNPSNFKGDNLPVEYVSWNDIVGTTGASEVINGITYYADGFIYKLNQATGKKYRLPTESEWEFAARGGTQSKGFLYSGSNTVGDVAWYSANSGSTTHAVGTKAPNELGIYDMSGNVHERCSDWYGAYTTYSKTNPTGPSTGSDRVFRGGGWGEGSARVRVSSRNGSAPSSRTRSIGLRLACSSN
ncbi:MAG: SUMF1/EgtB/PvdO family nonheme iron enzyme [Bacteroidales bacterium]|nr:SUMF1/EgtB/PvdO family nonheme iron enzyme [Bacteroidales bacterium]